MNNQGCRSVRRVAGQSIISAYISILAISYSITVGGMRVFANSAICRGRPGIIQSLKTKEQKSNKEAFIIIVSAR
jgi:hypothetical protein